MQAIESGGVHASFDPYARVVRLHMRPGCAPRGADAHRIADEVEKWIVGSPEIRAMIDCEGATGMYVEWRVAWTTRITRNARKVRLAYTNASGMAGYIMPLFARMSGIDARSFKSRSDAERWLCAAGAAPMVR